MGSKRDHNALLYSDNDEAAPSSSNKRQRKRAPNQGKQNPEQQTMDLTYGQRCVFPGLGGATVPSDDDLEYEDEGDALAYLASVRLEASGIPHVLIAPKAGPQLPSNLASDGDGRVDRSIYTNGVGDSRGYYHDGAYTAVPDTGSSDGGGYPSDEKGDANSDSAARERLHTAYYSSLVSRFTALRQQLHQDPAPDAIYSLPRNHEIEVGPFGPNSPTFRLWTNRLRYTDPLPVQIAAMDKSSVLKLLRIILGDKFLRRGYELRERTSCWIWSLLARLPDRGELGHIEVGWVRELGKRAVLMLISITQMAALREEVEDDMSGDEVRDGEGDQDDDEFLGGLIPEEEDGEPPSRRASSPHPPPKTSNGYHSAGPQTKEPDAADNDGELDMDLDMEDGEVSDSPAAEPDMEADIAAAKARLLAQLENTESREETTSRTGYEEAAASAVEEEIEEERERAFDETRSRINMRATLNMILTVAGEFYGQRDLLEFRDPFTGL